jgi:hypothetical protein
MEAPPEQTPREPPWLWPLVAAVGAALMLVLAAIAASHPGAVTPADAPRSAATGQQPGIVVWIGAVFTLLLYSILYRENPLYRFAEHVFVGLAAGYSAYTIWNTILFPEWYQPLFIGGKWLWTLALVAAGMYFMVYNRRLSWMSRMVMLMLLGFDSGIYFRLWAGDWVAQLGDSFRPLIGPAPPYIQFTNIIFVGTMLAVMVYFLFSFEQRRRGIRMTAATGRWLMMIAFGAMFGSTIMARMSLFIGRLAFLFQDWIHLIPRNPGP